MRPPLRVLIVDDELLVRATLERAMRRRCDLTVVGGASDGPMALRLIREQAPDVVLMDVGLPGMSGIEVARRLRAGDDDTPVLFFTGEPAAVDQAVTIDRTAVVLKATGGCNEVLDALRQVASGPAIAAKTARAPAGFRRNASTSTTASEGSGSPDITTTRGPRRPR